MSPPEASPNLHPGGAGGPEGVGELDQLEVASVLGVDAIAADDGTCGDATPPLVLLHGFTQSRDAFGPMTTVLRRRRRTVAIDLPGHGTSTSVIADLPQTAAMVIDTLDSGPVEHAGHVDLLGYSLGARAALHVALAFPDRVRAMVLLSGTAGIEDPAARAERRQRDEALATELESGTDVVGFLDRWLAAPMWATLPRASAELDARRANDPAGLAASLRLAGAGAQEPLWWRLAEIHQPTLVVCGASDQRFTARGQRLTSLMPSATLSVVPGAGHAVHLEQPRVVGRIVDAWLHSLPDR